MKRATSGRRAPSRPAWAIQLRIAWVEGSSSAQVFSTAPKALWLDSLLLGEKPVNWCDIRTDCLLAKKEHRTLLVPILLEQVREVPVGSEADGIKLVAVAFPDNADEC